MSKALHESFSSEVAEHAHHPALAVRIAVPLGIALMLGVVSLGAKGRGYKTWVMRNVFHRAPAQVAVDSPHPVSEGTPDPAIRFKKVLLPVTNGVAFTSVEVGPDHKLYAGSDDGRIFRFQINPDGTVGTPQIITSLQKAEGGPRLVTGFCFDPHATADAPIIWVSHGYRAFENVPDFSGRITRMAGKDLEVVQDVVVNLPRSIRDHLNNQPAFGPDRALYWPQGGNTASGAPDAYWGARVEHLLSATILRLDVTNLPPGKAIDAKTVDAGGSYDPYAPGAPLTIYATGVRNAYDLVWASNGNLYVPVNGASCGGNTPAGPGVPAIYNVAECEDDWLFCVHEGKYYGHPNPTQGHFVLNHGNPDGKKLYDEIPEYPVGTLPDSNWEPATFNFGPHISANGILEYRGNAFGGKLDRKLMVCRFNVGSDIICLGLDAAGKVNSVQTKVPGLADLANPLDIAEDRQTGNLYIAEYGGQRITLARPIAEQAFQPALGQVER